MKSLPTMRRWLLGLATAAVVAGVRAVAAWSRGPADAKPDAAPGGAAAGNWSMFGGTVQRNLVNTFEKNVPIDWNVEKGQEKNVKWSVPLGDKAYGGPV